MAELAEDAQELANDIRDERRRTIRSCGTFPYLVGKALNEVLIGVRQGLSISAKDVVRVVLRAGQAVGVIYVRPGFNHIGSSRYSCRNRKEVAIYQKQSFFWLTKSGNARDNITAGCSCRDETLEETCVHTSHLTLEHRIWNLIQDILSILVPHALKTILREYCHSLQLVAQGSDIRYGIIDMYTQKSLARLMLLGKSGLFSCGSER